MQKPWAEIDKITSSSGIYAWYYSPKLSNRDINDTIRVIEAAKKEEDLDVANKAIIELLENAIFSRFQETQYEVHLKGKLKANYAGEINHVPSISSTLVDRLVTDPQRLWGVKDILLRVAPSFSSPLYIGMAKSLRVRLASHKKLIEAYRVNPDADFIGDLSDLEKDHSFAKEVVVRRLQPSQLFVCVEEIQDDYIDLENILNRINFPLFGRN